MLLDRSSPRHSTWTPAARAVAEIYKQSEKSLDSKLSEYLEDSFQKEIKIGCLEGLSDLAKASADKLLTKTKIFSVTLNIYDLNLLETKFLSGELDLVFTFREPNRKKHNKSKLLGYQSLNKTKSSSNGLYILSSFENQLFKPKKNGLKKLISNSLAVRTAYQKEYGGICTVPSEVQSSKPSKDGFPVLLIAKDSLSKDSWNLLKTIS